MATEIRNIPTLKGNVAKTFIEMSERTAKEKKATIDFSKQIEIGKKILAKAKID